MRNYVVIVFLLFATTPPLFSGCGQSKPSAVAVPAGAGTGKGDERLPRSSSSTATSDGARGRTTDRTSDGKPRLFSPIRTDMSDQEVGVVGMTTPGGTVHTKITGLGALRGARKKIYTTNPVLRGGEFQDAWIDAYGLLLATVKLLEKMRDNLSYKQTSLQEAAQDHHLVPDGLPVLTAAGIDKFNGLHEQWLTMHKSAHDLAMKFCLREKELPAKLLFTRPPLETPLPLTIQLICPECETKCSWDGGTRKLPFCCRQSLLVRQVQNLAAQDDFDYSTAQGKLTQLLAQTQDMHTLLEQYLAKLMPTTRSAHFANAHLITMPAIRQP